jgi:proteasome accessory factor B
MASKTLARQLKVIHLLLRRRTGISAASIAAHLGYNVRYVYRDLKVLEEAGFPIYSKKDGRNSSWAFVEGFKYSMSVPFTAEELMALQVARKMMLPIEGAVFEQEFNSAFEKIRAQLTEPVCDYLDKCSSLYHIANGPQHGYERMTAVVRMINEGIKEQQAVEFTYQAFFSGSENRRVVYPYGVMHHGGALYLVAHCRLRNSIRNFSVDRIKMPNLLEEKFDRPSDFDLEEYMADAFGAYKGPTEEVRLHFDPPAARYIKESVWHQSQVLENCDGGGCLLKMEVPISEELERWIFTWTPHCEVLKPLSLRKRIEESCRLMLARYQDKSLKIRKIKKSAAKKSAGKKLKVNNKTKSEKTTKKKRKTDKKKRSDR